MGSIDWEQTIMYSANSERQWGELLKGRRINIGGQFVVFAKAL
jgi:hypothetical protein